MAPTAREALPLLLDSVRDPAVREIAWETAVDSSIYLTKDPLADVKTFLEDKNAGVRCVTAWVLHCARAMEIKQVIAVQVKTLKAPDSWARRQAARFWAGLERTVKTRRRRYRQRSKIRMKASERQLPKR